jgi:rSAM/selenodomain-associated transferase 1
MPTLPRLIVMTRFPAPGRVKTRLISALGEDGAALLHRRMAERTLRTAGGVETPIEVEVCYTDADEPQMRRWLGQEILLREQRAGDLGQRMHKAFRAAFAEGAPCVVVIGADSPDLDRRHLLQAFELLGENDLVLGPAEDGGYYLIGLRRPIPALFEGIAWSTDRVLAQTLRITDELGLKVAQTERLFDVDRPEDLARVPADLLDGLARC